MPKPYEHKPFKMEKPVNHYCETCKHFRWGLITPFYDTNGSCELTNYSKSNRSIACPSWEMK